ncbi:hypothetical protein QYF61_019864 [Mycteria americana]|uniref:Uncharacterized protein n=1 Tax=Mycteria americana TaxID=33587 RepID=A0AAN7NMB2_MYCAM|nr:hypothetical protein QYF61_019864 [Mycteria americana]
MEPSMRNPSNDIQLLEKFQGSQKWKTLEENKLLSAFQVYLAEVAYSLPMLIYCKIFFAVHKAKQSQLPQPLLIRLLLQTLHQLRCPSLDSLQHLNVSLVVGVPKLNTGFEVRPHQCRVQGHDHFPSPAGHTIFDTSQDAIGFLGHLGTLLAHIQATVNNELVSDENLVWQLDNSSRRSALVLDVAEIDVHFSCGFNPSFKENWRINKYSDQSINVSVRRCCTYQLAKGDFCSSLCADRSAVPAEFSGVVLAVLVVERKLGSGTGNATGFSSSSEALSSQGWKMLFYVTAGDSIMFVTTTASGNTGNTVEEKEKETTPNQNMDDSRSLPGCYTEPMLGKSPFTTCIITSEGQVVWQRDKAAEPFTEEKRNHEKSKVTFVTADGKQIECSGESNYFSLSCMQKMQGHLFFLDPACLHSLPASLRCCSGQRLADGGFPPHWRGARGWSQPCLLSLDEWCTLGWEGRVGTCSQRWWRRGLKAGTDCEGGGSSAGRAKCSLAYASQKLKYDPALLGLKQFSFESCTSCLQSLSFREQKVSLVQDALVALMRVEAGVVSPSALAQNLVLTELDSSCCQGEFLRCGVKLDSSGFYSLVEPAHFVTMEDFQLDHLWYKEENKDGGVAGRKALVVLLVILILTKYYHTDMGKVLESSLWRLAKLSSLSGSFYVVCSSSLNILVRSEGRDEGEVLQPSDHLHGPPLDLLQQAHVLLMLGAPELKAVLQVGSHESGAEGENHLPRPADHASFDAAQDTVGFLGCERTLLGLVELLINQHPQVLLLRAALNPFSTQTVFVLGIAPTRVQDLALGLVECHEVRMGPPLKPVKVPLDGMPSLQRVNCTTQLGVGKLAVVVEFTKQIRVTAPIQASLVVGWRLNHFPGQSVPMLDNPLGEEKFPNIQSKPPLAQLEAISSCPITCYLGEETDPHLSTTSFQAKQSQLPQPLLIRLGLQTLHQLHCPSLDTLQHLNVPLVVGGPKLNTGFEDCRKTFGTVAEACRHGQQQSAPVRCTRGISEPGEPQGSRESRQEPAARTAAADKSWVGPGAMVAKPPHMYKRSPWGALATRSATNGVGKQGVVRRFVQKGVREGC